MLSLLIIYKEGEKIFQIYSILPVTIITTDYTVSNK